MPEQQNNGVPTPRVLVVTNDFPPTLGGIQTYIRDYLNALVTHAGIPAENIVVFASTQDADAAAEFDAAVDYHVVRWPRKIMLPTPQVARRMRQLIREYHIDTVWFGAAAPLAAIAPSARAAGATRVVASTHGHEVGWSMFPGTRAVLRYIGRNVDTLTFVSLRARAHRRGLRPHVAWEPIPGGVDAAASPDERSERLRHAWVLRRRSSSRSAGWFPGKGRTPRGSDAGDPARGSDAHLVIVGPGDYAKLQRRAEKQRRPACDLHWSGAASGLCRLLQPRGRLRPAGAHQGGGLSVEGWARLPRGAGG